MMTVTASELRARCFELLTHVEKTGEAIQITKRGNVVAELRPSAHGPKLSARAGFAMHSLEITGDIIEPLDVEWEAMK
jgi:prevent-host-death family protein